jgi:hypothetical protein
VINFDKRVPKHIEKLIRTQERLVRQSNRAWACGVRAEYNHQESKRLRYYKRADRLNEAARAAHKALVTHRPEFGWSQP